MRNKELEYKYSANEINFIRFEEFMTKLAPMDTVRASGYDHFYDSKQNKSSFARHRVGPDFNQMTFKRKTTSKNNYLRTEHNIDLAKHVTKTQVSALLGEFEYTYNTSIFKSVFVYNFDRYNFVYYICYDLTLNELGRFVEIEMSESYPWKDEQEAWHLLHELEKSLLPLGLSPQCRLKKSLFEMFKK